MDKCMRRRAEERVYNMPESRSVIGEGRGLHGLWLVDNRRSFVGAVVRGWRTRLLLEGGIRSRVVVGIIGIYRPSVRRSRVLLSRLVFLCE